VAASVITIGGGIVLGLFQLRSSRHQLGQSAADEFRGDLLTRITQQDTKNDALEARIARQEQKLDAQDAKIDAQHEEIESLRDELADRDAHLTVITHWGTHSTEDPPRTPPHWRAPS
jgi:septal ring factor EnvC (AmiA/AmiB activator)